MPEGEIAGLLQIDPKTLRKYYREELDYGHTKANAKVAENLYRIALGEGRESVTATIFWLKRRARWSEASVRDDDEDDTDAEIIFKVVYEATPERVGLGHTLKSGK